MKNASKIFAASALLVLGALTFSPQVMAQSNSECMVEGISGFYIQESSNQVTGRFQIDGDTGCEPTEVSIAVWLSENENGHPINDQQFVSGNTGQFGLIPEGQYPFHTISTALPTTDDLCFIQVEIVRGGQKGENGTPQYGDRLINGMVAPNPACKEVETVVETEEVEVVREVEVPVEVVREIPVERVVEVQTTQKLPDTGPGALFAIPALTTVVAGAGHYIVNRRK